MASKLELVRKRGSMRDRLIVALDVDSMDQARSLVERLAGEAGLFKVGPDYRRPKDEVPQQYKSPDLGVWKTAEPLDRVAKGAWWEVFKDETLDEL